ncbi:MAG TPA: hypothetical protein VI488_20035 [Candidatus Angelobacter sp.]
MKGKLVRVALSVLSVLFFALMPAAPVLAQDASSKPIAMHAAHRALMPAVSVRPQDASPKPIVMHAANHDISPPLSQMAANAPPRPSGGQRIRPEHETPPIPGAGAAAGPDLALQQQTLPLVGTINGLNFAGISADGVAPPDTNGSVGDSVTNQYVQIVNEEYEVFNKTTGAVILGPTQVDVIWSGFSGACAASNGGDVNVLFDKAAARWVVAQLSNSFTSYCIAVSTSDDATGSYARYEFDFSPNIPDYPKLAVWPDAYYGTTNTFQNGSTFIGAMPCAYDRASMLTGGAANAICFQQNSSVASLLPSDLDGSTPPPAGEPNFFVELASTSSLGLFKFHADFSVPANSTFTGPTTIPVTTFSEACGGFGTCVPQVDTTQQLDSLGDRLMFRLAYRNFGDHEALVVNHSVTAGSSTGVRWYEIRSPNGTPTIFQQGTFAPDSEYRWMGSVAMDKSGDMAVGYSVSSSSMHPAIRFSGRVPSDPAGTLESEASIIEGGGSQNGGLNRWGDYSGMSIDPGDDCTFFYTTEYIPTDGSFNWATQIASFKFASCGSTAPDFSLSASPSSQTVVQGNSTSYTVTVSPINGYSNTVTFSASGLPTGASATFNPTSSGSPNYPPSTMTVTTSSSTPGGTYTLTITGTDGTITHTTSVTLVVVAADFSISATPGATSVRSGSAATFTATLSPINTFSGNVNMTVSGCPASSTCTFSPNPVTVTSPKSSTSALTVSTGRKTPAATYSIKITGTSGSLTHSVTVSLRVTGKR